MYISLNTCSALNYTIARRLYSSIKLDTYHCNPVDWYLMLLVVLREWISNPNRSCRVFLILHMQNMLWIRTFRYSDLHRFRVSVRTVGARCLGTATPTSDTKPRIAVVGSGPGGFYAAQRILKVCSHSNNL